MRCCATPSPPTPATRPFGREPGPAPDALGAPLVVCAAPQTSLEKNEGSRASTLTFTTKTGRLASGDKEVPAGLPGHRQEGPESPVGSLRSQKTRHTRGGPGPAWPGRRRGDVTLLLPGALGVAGASPGEKGRARPGRPHSLYAQLKTRASLPGPPERDVPYSLCS